MHLSGVKRVALYEKGESGSSWTANTKSLLNDPCSLALLFHWFLYWFHFGYGVQRVRGHFPERALGVNAVASGTGHRQGRRGRCQERLGLH